MDDSVSVRSFTVGRDVLEEGREDIADRDERHANREELLLEEKREITEQEKRRTKRKQCLDDEAEETAWQQDSADSGFSRGRKKRHKTPDVITCMPTNRPKSF